VSFVVLYLVVFYSSKVDLEYSEKGKDD